MMCTCRCGTIPDKVLTNGLFYQNCAISMNYAISHELCNWMQFEVDCAKLHHPVISGLFYI